MKLVEPTRPVDGGRDEDFGVYRGLIYGSPIMLLLWVAIILFIGWFARVIDGWLARVLV